MVIYGNAAHVIVSGGRNRDSLLRWIDARSQAARVDRRELRRERCTERFRRVEKRTTPGRDLGEYAAGHDVARSQLRQRIACQHEAFAASVDEDGTFAAQRLGCQRCRIASDFERGRMKLHEFRIGDDRTCARGNGKADAAGFHRVGGHSIEMPDAAGREHNRAGRDDEGSGGSIIGLAKLKPHDCIAFGQQRFSTITLDDANRWRVSHRCHKRRDDGLAGHVALDMDDAPRRMRGFAPDCELAFEIAVERHAILQKIVDARGSFARKTECNVVVNNASADGDGVRSVSFGRIAFSDGCCDPALRPCTRCAFAERGSRNHRDGPRCEFQRTEQAREPAADDDDVGDGMRDF